MNRKILVAVDVQNDFINGTLGSKNAQAIMPNVINKINQYLQDNNDIFFTCDTHNNNYLMTQEGKNLPIKHCLLNTNGWNLYKDIYDLIKFPKFISKNTFGTMELPKSIASYTKTINIQIEIVGLCTDICVISNAIILKTAFPESEITIDASCCAGVTLESHNKALDILEGLQFKVINRG